MTVGGWILFGIVSSLILCIGVAIFSELDKWWHGVIIGLIMAALIAGLYFGMTWYFNNTASGSRALIDEQSNLSNGMERTITVYTADGNVIAQYSGRIDLAANSGGYVKFDFEGKRYIYYNCFVESIATIDGGGERDD